MTTTTINSGYLATGITLPGGYLLSNTTSGTIANTAAAAVLGTAGGLPDTVANAGSIIGGTGAGVSLLSGGVVTNQASGTIGGAIGVGVTGSSGTVTNLGRVTAAGSGLLLEAGGSLDNQAGGTIIAGYRGMVAGGGPGGVTNGGFVSAAATGIVLYGTGATAANNGTINAGVDGIYVAAGTATNQGMITAVRHGIFMNAGGHVTNLTGGSVSGDQNGVVVSGGGVVLNAAGASITGRYIGLDIYGGAATVTNAGTIGATETLTGVAVKFGVSAANRLVVDPGAVFNGLVDGGNTIGSGQISSLEMASAAGACALSGIGTKYVGFADVTVDSAAAWTLTGANTIAANVTLTDNGTLTNAGSLDAGGGLIVVNGSLANTGGITTRLIMTGGGRLSNAVTGILNGGIYAATGGAGRTVSNAGTITATSGSVINMQSGGTVTNVSGATIAGVQGVDISGSAVIANQGLILATGAPGTSGSAVILRGGGSVDNTATATISGEFYGVVIGNGVGSVTNHGSIHGGGVVGVALNSGGGVTNFSGATITGHYDGITMNLTPATVSNAGYVGAEAGNGIALNAGGSVSNLTGGTVTGAGAAVLISGNPGTVSNDGTLSGGGNVGVVLNVGGTVSNTSSGWIGAYGAIAIGGGTGTVVNRGMIVASGPRAITLAAGYANLVAVVPGGLFTGLVDGGNTIGASVGSTLELRGGGLSAGGISGLGTQFIDFARITVVAGAPWVFTGTNTIGAGVVLNDSGTVAAPATLRNDGSVTLNGGSLEAEFLTGGGVINMASGNNLLAFATSGGQTISGFDGGDIIDMNNLTFATGATALVHAGTLTVTSNGVSQTVAVSGIGDGTSFVTGRDSVNGTQIVACFAAGTRIETDSGPLAVEKLSLGDLLVTANGECEPIVWIGRRTVDCRRHPNPETVWPVRVAAGARGPFTPARDLWLSPDHSVFVNDVLVPVKLLIDGAGIAQVRADRVEYFHVELKRHEVILAEGMAVESYLDTGDRADYGGSDVIRLFPHFGARDVAGLWETKGAAALVLKGQGLEAVRAGLRRQEGSALLNLPSKGEAL